MAIQVLSDFKDEEAVTVVAKLLSPIFRIAQNSENAKAKEKDMGAFLEAVLSNNARAVMDIFAILSKEDPAEYHCDGADVMGNAVKVFTDPPLLALFGLQRQTAASSGSASTTGEAAEE